MITPGVTIRTRSVLLVAIPVLIAVGLSLLWYQSQRVLGLDAYYYVEYTKELAAGRLTVFGSNWPRGYPLLGSLLTHVGPSAFMALVIVSGASLLAMAVAAVKLLPRDLRSSWSAFAVLCALCSVPAVPQLLGMPMSELPFAACLLGSIYFIRHWPARWAVWMSLFLGFGSFCIRYAGIFMFGLLALLFVVYFEELRDGKRLKFYGGWYTFFAVLTALLLWSNVHATGHVSGADRGWGGGTAVLPEQIAHLGWSVVGALSSTRIKDLIGGVGSWQGMLVGWIVMGSIGAVCLRAVVHPKEPMARPLALLVLGYLGAFVMMRAMRSFPDINEPRYFVPVLFPLALLLLLEIRLQARKVLGAAAVAAVVVGFALSLRGVSEETYGDVAFARRALAAQLQPGDVVRVNGAALSLAAYFPNAFQWPQCGEDETIGAADYVVVAGSRSRRGATTAALDDCGRELAASARQHGFVVWHRSGASLVLRRDPSLATSSSAESRLTQ